MLGVPLGVHADLFRGGFSGLSGEGRAATLLPYTSQTKRRLCFALHKSPLLYATERLT